MGVVASSILFNSIETLQEPIGIACSLRKPPRNLAQETWLKKLGSRNHESACQHVVTKTR